nr:hypothetical protein [Tanacetum cinerariifolium]
NTDSLNSKITDLSEKLSDSKTMLYHYKLGLSQVEARLVEFKNQEIKFCEKIRGLEFKVESKTNRIEKLTNKLEMIKKEKEGLDRKLTGFQSASKDLDNLIGSQRFDKNKEDDTITDYTRLSPSIESNPNDLQNNSSSVSENRESTTSILSKPEIMFVKAADSPIVIKTNKAETVRKTSVKYAKMCSTGNKINMEFNLPRWQKSRTRAPHGEELGLIKPLSDSSFSCSDRLVELPESSQELPQENLKLSLHHQVVSPLTCLQSPLY